MSELFAAVNNDNLPSKAFLFYNPLKKNKRETIHYNIEAWNILSHSLQSDDMAITLSDISNLCLSWKTAFDKKHVAKSCNEENEMFDMTNYMVAIFESHRRKYTVNATCLMNTHFTKPQSYYYLFTLERFNADNLNLFAAFRRWNLNPREQQISKLLIEDRSNKEIARMLNLSINTVKVYIRFLMTKLNATSRTGIVSQLLSNIE